MRSQFFLCVPNNSLFSNIKGTTRKRRTHKKKGEAAMLNRWLNEFGRDKITVTEALEQRKWQAEIKEE